MHVAAAELLGGDLLARRRLHQRRAAEEDRAGAAHDDVLVAHRRHVGAARRARAHHHRDLRDAERRQARLVVEDAAEVLAVGEDLRLQRQEGAARVDEVDAGQAVLERDLLRAQVLLHRQREVRAALHRGVVGDDHRLAPVDRADAGDDAGGRAPRRRTGRRPRAARARGTGVPGSSSASTRSRGSSLPRSVCRARASSGPPACAPARRSRSSSTSACMRARLAGKAGSFGRILVSMRSWAIVAHRRVQGPLARIDGRAL